MRTGMLLLCLAFSACGTEALDDVDAESSELSAARHNWALLSGSVRRQSDSRWLVTANPRLTIEDLSVTSLDLSATLVIQNAAGATLATIAMPEPTAFNPCDDFLCGNNSPLTAVMPSSATKPAEFVIMRISKKTRDANASDDVLTLRAVP